MVAGCCQQSPLIISITAQTLGIPLVNPDFSEALDFPSVLAKLEDRVQAVECGLGAVETGYWSAELLTSA